MLSITKYMLRSKRDLINNEVKILILRNLVMNKIIDVVFCTNYQNLKFEI